MIDVSFSSYPDNLDYFLALGGGTSFDLREKAANGGDEAHDTLLFYEGEGKGSFPQF